MASFSVASSARLLRKAPVAGFAMALFMPANKNKQTSECEAVPPLSTNLQKRMTAIGQFSVLSQTKYNPSIVSFVMALSGKKPLTAEEFAALWSERGMMTRHPRFHQKLSTEQPGYFVPTSTKDYALEEDRHPVEDHLSETVFPSLYRLDVIHRLKDLQTTTWDLTDSLWRISIAPWGTLGSSGCIDKTLVEADENETNGTTIGESLLFFQGHHALADGSSMAAAFLDIVDEAEQFRQEIIEFLDKRRGKAKNLLHRILQACQRWMWLTGGSLKALFHQVHLYWSQLWDHDPWNQVRNFAEEHTLGQDSDDVDRNLSWTLVAKLEQVKWVAQQLGGEKVTVNDLLCACITAALSRQLDEHRKRLAVLTEDVGATPLTLPKQSHMHISLPVHLKGGVVLPGESVGNNIGGIVVRVLGEGDISPEERLIEVHKRLTAIKNTPAALLSHMLAKGLSYSSRVLPSSWISWLYSRSNAGSIAVVSNNRGAPKHIHMGGRRVESIYGFVPLPPGIPIGIVVMSYAGNVNLTLTAEPWAVPDADRFLGFVLLEYLKLLDLAKLKAKTNVKA